ncbi:MAG: endolytic transglycosylase MltG [Acidobacteriota bacterium]
MTARRLLGRLLVVVVSLALLALAGAGAAIYVLSRPYQGYPGAEATVVIAPGAGVQHILNQLQGAGVLRDARFARLVLDYRLGRPTLRAGEYHFQGPLAPAEVLAKLVRGDVVLHPVTLPEGLDMEAIADRLVQAGLGERSRLLVAMRDPGPIRDLDPQAPDLEGYLFPETYAFARGTPEAEIVATLVRTFRRRFDAEIRPLLDPGAPLAVRRIVTLASIVEQEARRDEERPVIAGVYANRLRLGMGLYADPTVVFALRRHGRYDGTIHKADLSIDDPYNTYRVAGLPPGPICSPGAKSLEAAARPADVPYLYFVARNDGTHAFAATLAEHNRNVEIFQKRYWRERRERR